MIFSKLKKKNSAIPVTVKASTAYIVCTIFQKCLSFITLPLFTRLLTKEQYGQYTIYSSWSGILTMFLTLNLAYGSFSKAMIKFEDKRDEYIASIQGICMLLSAIFLVIYLPFSRWWNKLFELPTPLMIVMVADILTQTAILLWSGKKRFEFKYLSVVLLTVITSIIGPLAAYILVKNSSEKGYARIIGYSGTFIIAGCVIFIYNMIKGKHLYNKQFWKFAFGFNVPLLIHYLSQVIFNQSDRIMISHLTGKGDAAMYGVAYNLAMILTFVLNAINNSYVPWFYCKIKEGNQHENKSVSCVIAVLMALLLLFIIWFAPEIILVMAGKNYSDAIWAVAPVAMSLLLLFYSQLFINVEFYYESKGNLVWASIGSAVVNVILNYLLIPIFGFIVAGYTTLLSYVIFVLCNLIAFKKVLKEENMKDDMYDYKGLFLILAAFFVIGFAGVFLYHLLFVRIIIAIIVLILLLINKNKIIDCLKVIRE